MRVMPFARQPTAQPVSRRTKRILALAGALLVLVVAGVVAWSAASPGTYTSKNGCIAVTIPNSMGGAILHQCGAAAKAQCHKAFTHHDTVSRLSRPECRAAGLAP